MKGFDSLELFFKCIFIQKNGNLLLKKRYYLYTVELFTWDKFLFEQYYDNHLDRVTRVSIVRNRDLDKYLKDINLRDLGIYTIL